MSKKNRYTKNPLSRELLLLVTVVEAPSELFLSARRGRPSLISRLVTAVYLRLMTRCTELKFPATREKKPL